MAKLTTSVLAGLASGTLVLGAGSRIAMRLVFAMDPAKRGEVTSVGATVGAITFSGTMQLVLTGAVMGLIGGVAYAALDPALPARGKGAAFAALAIGAAGWILLDRDNPDFHRFGAPILNIAIFGALLAAFCLALVAIERRLDGTLSIRGRRLAAPLVAIALFATSIGAILMLADHPGIAALLAALAIAAAIARWRPALARRALLAPAAAGALVLAWALMGILARA